jgi:hypothetical protein
MYVRRQDTSPGDHLAFSGFPERRPEPVATIPLNHPGNQARINTLERHYRANPTVFGKFSSD